MAQTDIVKLTDAQPFQTAYLPFNTIVPSANGLSITFDFYAYGGDGADGISFSLLMVVSRLEQQVVLVDLWATPLTTTVPGVNQVLPAAT
ncbi:MAG: hypothetical protein EDM05_043150 [Leptolyngbya sp. IPPAS B-1204]